MSEVEITTSDTPNPGAPQVTDTAPAGVPPEPQADPAAPPQVPVDTPNPAPMSPTEVELMVRIDGLQAQMETIEDAWHNFALSASKAIDEVKKAPAVESHNMLHDLIKAIHDRVTRIEARFL